jgi:phosphohistidine phosphatase
MYLYLVQHAQAKPKEQDPDRPLSEQGIADLKKVTRFLEEQKLNINTILHSPKTRAKQTAGILAEALNSGQVSETDGLTPLDDPLIWVKRISQKDEDIMLVGHLPNISKLASLLLCGDEKRTVVDFHMGGVVCLEGGESAWSAVWVVIPSIL